MEGIPRVRRAPWGGGQLGTVSEAVCEFLGRSGQQLGGSKRSRVGRGGCCFGKSACMRYQMWRGGRRCKAYCARDEVYGKRMMKSSRTMLGGGIVTRPGSHKLIVQ